MKVKFSQIHQWIIKYFDKFQAFCFDLSSDSVLKGKIKF